MGGGAGGRALASGLLLLASSCGYSFGAYSNPSGASASTRILIECFAGSGPAP